jgi:hypothetical protein
MDVVEFLDTISEMCKEGAKTTIFQDAYDDDIPAYIRDINTGNWDLNFIYKTYMESRDSNIRVQRREVLQPNYNLAREWEKKFDVADMLPNVYNFDYYDFTVAMRYALYAYIINIPIESLTYDLELKEDSSKIRTPGWYIAPLREDNYSKVISGEYALIDVLSPNARFIIGYRGQVELPKEYEGSIIDTANEMSFDIHVNPPNIYFNMNHDQSFEFQVGFNPDFKSGMGFMNWRGIPF